MEFNGNFKRKYWLMEFFLEEISVYGERIYLIEYLLILRPRLLA